MEKLTSKWQLVDVEIGRIKLDPHQPRMDFPEQERQELTQNLLENGQKEPITGYWDDGGFFIVISGARRVISAGDAKLKSLAAIALDKKPDPAELYLHQFLANAHRLDLNPVELCNAYKELMQRLQINATELAKTVSKSKTYVSNVLSIDSLPDVIKQLIRERKIGLAKAALLARMTLEEQLRSVDSLVSGQLDRQQLESKTRKKKAEDKPVRRVTLETPMATMSMAGKAKMTVDDLLEVLQTLVRECRRARSQNLDLTTLSSILRDHAKINTPGGA